MKKRTQTTNYTAANNVKRQQVLDAILPHVAFDGWTKTAYERAIKQAGFSVGEGDLLFPQGMRDVIELFGAMADAAMQQAIDDQPGYSRMRTRDKIIFAVRARLESLQPHREAVRRMMYWYAMPFNVPLGMKRIYKTVDLMWRAAGDTSTDFNFYTKRALLAGVVKATILFWLDDETENCAASWDFLDRRIGDVMKFGKTISLMKEWKPAEIVEMVRERFKRVG